MEIPRKKCVYCGRGFRPDRRVRRQKRCLREECRRAANRRKVRSWVQLHPGFLAARRAKVRAWAKGYPDYWQGYRQAHPVYCQRDNRRRAEAAFFGVKRTVFRSKSNTLSESKRTPFRSKTNTPFGGFLIGA